MAQAFSGIGGDVVDVIKVMFGKKAVDQFLVENRAFDESCAGGNVFLKAAAEVIEDDNAVAGLDQVFSDVRPNESCAASYD